ncbi:hypothetical protein [Campylobacter troglodytis]|uniref:hypothetical protein n=1 Tax=Campylobacter troglodytis TaxID=654363 RepID=UPI00115BCB79|nr:hypothetical protein [Campylobacter troglodytis]TQR60462.1 hypothetical protein DMC01_05650 [Campylobacter troglodytis]
MFINQAKQGLIKPCLLNLSFIPLTNKHEANNKASQKIQLTNEDINKGYIAVEFKLPLRFIGEWEGIERTKSRVESKEILEMYFSYGKDCKKIKTNSKIESDVNLHIITQGYKLGESLAIKLESDDGRTINASGKVGENGEVVIYNVLTKNKG